MPKSHKFDTGLMFGPIRSPYGFRQPHFFRPSTQHSSETAPASMVQLVRTSSIMRVVISSKSRLNWKFSNFPNHLWLLSDYRGMAKWFGAYYNEEVRFSSAVKCKKRPQVLTSPLNPRRNYYYYCILITFVLLATSFIPNFPFLYSSLFGDNCLLKGS